jgi:hypothetical protein
VLSQTTHKRKCLRPVSGGVPTCTQPNDPRWPYPTGGELFSKRLSRCFYVAEERMQGNAPGNALCGEGNRSPSGQSIPLRKSRYGRVSLDADHDELRHESFERKVAGSASAGFPRSAPATWELGSTRQSSAYSSNSLASHTPVASKQRPKEQPRTQHLQQKSEEHAIEAEQRLTAIFLLRLS